MANYSSFLVRCWLKSGGHSYSIEHVQSGERTTVSALPDLLRWMESINSRLALQANPEEETNPEDAGQ